MRLKTSQVPCQTLLSLHCTGGSTIRLRTHTRSPGLNDCSRFFGQKIWQTPWHGSLQGAFRLQHVRPTCDQKMVLHRQPHPVRCRFGLRCCWCLVLWRDAVCWGVSLGVLRCGGAALVCRGVLLWLRCPVVSCALCCVLRCCAALRCCAGWLCCAVVCAAGVCFSFCPLFLCSKPLLFFRSFENFLKTKN